MKNMFKVFLCITFLFFVVCDYMFHLLPSISYSSEYFGIDVYTSDVDYDQDGLEDQSDILQGVYDYIATKPKYKSVYYATGYPNDEYGVCSDVVIQGLLAAGYDLQQLMNEDIINHRAAYDIEIVDKNIDFRRVVNMNVYFNRNAITLSNDIDEIELWQPGDIVVFEGHIGIISNKRNVNGVPFVIHHAGVFQIRYEENILETREDVIGHYRMS